MDELLKKAYAAARTARIVVAKDPNSAANRAYYVMFDIARVLLYRLDPELVAAKTHASVLRRFAKHFVRAGQLPEDFGKMLNRAADLREMADYGTASVSVAEAKALLRDMDRFIKETRTLLDELAS